VTISGNLKPLLFLLLLLISTGCSPRSLQDYKEEGEGVVHTLVEDLKAIRTRDELLSVSGRLRRHFDRLAEIMITAEEYRREHTHTDTDECYVPNRELSDQLREELNRLYRIQGGRQIIEKCQEQALHRLDAYQKKQLPGDL